MKRKRVLVTFEVVEEGLMESNERIVRDLLEWFREDAVSVPWVKEVKHIIVKDP